MVAFNQNALCREAEPYYYDFLFGPNSPIIPRSLADHMGQCTHCRQQIHRLHGVLAEAELGPAPRPAEADKDIIDTLSLHFEYMDEHVTCTHVKPFVPGLLVPSAKIRIPTPITAHLDHCRECAQDLEMIRDLDLYAEQLVRLGRLYAESPNEDVLMCRRALWKIPVVGSVSLEGVEAGTLDHLCVCPRCRAQVYDYREAILYRKWFNEPDGGAILCGDISMAHLFDYVVPYGRAAADREEMTGLEEPVASHVRACPRCLEKTQGLHRTLYGIAERADSGTATIFVAKECANEAGDQTDGLYAGYPVDVKVIHREPEPVAGRFSLAAVGATLKRRVSDPRIKPFVKAALLAAAMIPLAFVFLANTQTASGLSLGQIADAFAKAPNVHVTKFIRSGREPLQEFWVAREPDVLLMAEDRGYVLCDLRARTERHTEPDLETSQPRELDEGRYAGARTIISRHLGFWQADLPSDAQWRHVRGDAATGTDLYELTWAGQTYGGPAASVKWEVVVDSLTKLPKRAVSFRRASSNGEWKYQWTSEFEYLADGDMRAVIEGYSLHGVPNAR